MFVCARDIVARTPDFDILAQNMTLRPWQWEMLHSFDDRTSLGAIARRIGVDLASITESLSALEQHGLIKIRTVTREEYRRVFEMAGPGTGAPSAHVDDEDDVPAAKAAPVETPAPQPKPIPPTGEPLSVRLEALRAKAEQAQAQRPPAIDTVPFQAQAAPTTIEIDTAELAANSAAVEAAQAPPEPMPGAGFGSQIADLKARLDEALASPPVAAPEPAAEAPRAAPTEAPKNVPAEQPPSRGGLADFTDALSGHSTEVVEEPVAELAPEPEPEPVEETYAPAASSLNGNGSAHSTIEFSLAGEPPPKPRLSPDAIEFSLGGNAPEPDPPKPPPLKY